MFHLARYLAQCREKRPYFLKKVPFSSITSFSLVVCCISRYFYFWVLQFFSGEPFTVFIHECFNILQLTSKPVDFPKSIIRCTTWIVSAGYGNFLWSYDKPLSIIKKLPKIPWNKRNCCLDVRSDAHIMKNNAILSV